MQKRFTYRLYDKENRRIRKDNFKSARLFEVYINGKFYKGFHFQGRWGHRQKENEITGKV